MYTCIYIYIYIYAMLTKRRVQDVEKQQAAERRRHSEPGVAGEDISRHRTSVHTTPKRVY